MLLHHPTFTNSLPVLNAPNTVEEVVHLLIAQKLAQRGDDVVVAVVDDFIDAEGFDVGGAGARDGDDGGDVGGLCELDGECTDGAGAAPDDEGVGGALGGGVPGGGELEVEEEADCGGDGGQGDGGCFCRGC